jgi:hypothetical protein
MYVVDEPQVVVAEQKRVPIEPQNPAGASMNNGLSVYPCQKSGNEVVGLAIDGRESHHPVPGSDARMTRAMQGNNKAAGENVVI